MQPRFTGPWLWHTVQTSSTTQTDEQPNPGAGYYSSADWLIEQQRMIEAQEIEDKVEIKSTKKKCNSGE
jgi:hypothetical protein